MREKFRPSLLLLSLLCLLISLPVAYAQGNGHGNGNGNGNKPTKKLIHLAPGTVEPMATGIAKIMLKTNGNAMQKFQVVGANVKSGTTYHLFVDGVEIAMQTAMMESGDMEASVEFMFFKKAKGGGGGDDGDGHGPMALPASLDPVTKIKHVEIRDSDNMVVLSGDFPQ